MALINKTSKKIGILIDPDKVNDETIIKLSTKEYLNTIDFILIGGSLIQKNNLNEIITLFKKNNISLPIYLFPGNNLQLSENADGILLLSLLSGRNPEFLIGQHVIAAPLLHKSKLTIEPTAYILIDGGKETAVSYISNTKPIPSDKADIALATALAGQQLGMKYIYLEAGSGANHHVPIDMIKLISNTLTIPIIVGGGIKSTAQINAIFSAGANAIILGSIIEKNPEIILEVSKQINKT